MTDDITLYTEEIAKRLLGEPNRNLSSNGELRYGNQGSLSIVIAGEKRGTWYDFENEVGGGVLDLISAKTGLNSPAAAAAWFRQEFINGVDCEPSLPCQYCGERIPDGKRNGSKFCSEACRVAGFRSRKKTDDESSSGRNITDTYDYVDENGALLYQVCRIEQPGKPKTFRQRRPDGVGGWDWSVKGTRLVPYRLPDLLERSDDAVVFVVEGERDADALHELGLTATTNAGGAGKWRPEFSEFLLGAVVVVIPDNDDAGRHHARTVADSLKGIAADVTVIELPGLPPKGDVSDWIKSGGTADALIGMLESRADTAVEERASDVPPADPDPCPLDSAAYYGVLGSIVRKIEPQTESDPAALLAQLIVALGSVIGRNCCVQVEATKHWPNLFAVICGSTGSARKGTGWRRVKDVAQQVDDTWPRCASGVASGEGIIDAVHDDEYGLNKKGMSILRRLAIEDKRLLIVEEEFGRLLRVITREGNITSQVLRDAWDGNDLRSMARSAGLKATGAHISVIGHITLEELMEVQSGSSVSNGFYNRFLWIFSKRTKSLPLGGDEVELEAEIQAIRKVLAARRVESDDHGREPLRMRISNEAKPLWASIYEHYTTEHLHPMKARALPFILRIALVLAFIEPNVYELGSRHLTAAEAIVAFGTRTVDRASRSATASTPKHRILAAIEMHREVSSTELHNLFNRNISGREIQSMCAELMRDGLIIRRTVPSGGRPRTLWVAVRSELGS